MGPSQGTQEKWLAASHLLANQSWPEYLLANQGWPEYLLANQGLEEGVSSRQSGPGDISWPIRDLDFYVVNQGCRDFLSSQGLSIVNQGISESFVAKDTCFPMRPWFRAPGWFPNHSLLSGTMGSCSKDLGTLCYPSLPRARKRGCIAGGSSLEVRLGHSQARGVPKVGGQCLGPGSALSGLGQIPCPPLWHPSAHVRF